MIRELLLGHARLISAGERARREHSAWLTRAMSDPRARLPRIPTRPVEEGGFAPVVATRAGRAWAESWWGGAFERME